MMKECTTDTIQAELLLLCAIHDGVYVGKSFKCSWSNSFVFMGDTDTCLVMMRTLHDYASLEIKKKLNKLLSLENVRNKDRVVVEPILKLSHSEIIQQLQQPEAVLHTIVH